MVCRGEKLKNKVLYTKCLVKDVEGIVREVLGFSRIRRNKYGDNIMEIRWNLESIDLKYLRSLFVPGNDDPDIIDCYDINIKQAKALQPYIEGNGIIDTKTHIFQLGCHQAPGWDWSEGYPRKIETDESK